MIHTLVDYSDPWVSAGASPAQTSLLFRDTYLGVAGRLDPLLGNPSAAGLNPYPCVVPNWRASPNGKLVYEATFVNVSDGSVATSSNGTMNLALYGLARAGTPGGALADNSTQLRSLFLSAAALNASGVSTTGTTTTGTDAALLPYMYVGVDVPTTLPTRLVRLKVHLILY